MLSSSPNNNLGCTFTQCRGSTSTRPDVAATPSIQTNGKRCSASDEQEEDSKRSECFKAADEMFQKLLSDPAANYGRALCEQISNKVNYCIPSFNAKCSTPDQIKDYQFGNLFNFLQTNFHLRGCSSRVVEDTA